MCKIKLPARQWAEIKKENKTVKCSPYIVFLMLNPCDPKQPPLLIMRLTSPLLYFVCDEVKTPQ